MKAVFVEAFGGAEQLQVIEAADPAPAAGEALIAVAAAGVGYVDVMAREGRYVFPAPGFIPGLEVAGKVIAVGDGVDRGWLGRRVLAFPGRGGGYAERLAIAAADLIALPDDVAFDDALAIGVNGLVAAFSLDRAHVATGERVLIRGAGGGIGLMATQLAADLTDDVTATTSSAERGERLTRLGATTVWNRRTDPPLAAGGFDVVIDTVGGPELPAHIALLRANGRYVLCGGLDGAPPPDFGLALLARFHQSPSFAVFSLNAVPTAQSAVRIAPMFEALRQGKLAALVDSRFPLADAAQSHRRLESGQTFGKIVLRTDLPAGSASG